LLLLGAAGRPASRRAAPLATAQISELDGRGAALRHEAIKCRKQAELAKDAYECPKLRAAAGFEGADGSFGHSCTLRQLRLGEPSRNPRSAESMAQLSKHRVIRLFGCDPHVHSLANYLAYNRQLYAVYKRFGM
jgi:hypothetical protein